MESMKKVSPEIPNNVKDKTNGISMAKTGTETTPKIKPKTKDSANDLLNKKIDLEKEKILEGIKKDLMSTYERFNHASSIENKGKAVAEFCFNHEMDFRKNINIIEEIFSLDKSEENVDINFFNYIFSFAKVGAAYNLPGIYRSVEKYLRSAKNENENYLMHSIPKHFLGILEGTTQEEYEHIIYTKFKSNSFITLKEDGNVYISQEEDEHHIINNLKKADILEKIEINNEEDKRKLDDIPLQIKKIKEELSAVYSSEYSPDGRFLGLRFSSENLLMAHTNRLKTLMEQLSNLGDQIIIKNNPDIDQRFAEANKLYEEIDSMFSRILSFDIFKKELIGLNLDEEKLYHNYITFWNEPNIRKFLEEDLGFFFERHNFQEQVYFLDYLRGVTITEGKRIKNFSKKYGVSGFNSFLSISHGGKEMGDKILTLGEKLPEEVAQKVFQKYGQIIDSVDKITDFAKNNFSKEIETKPSLIQKIEETLYLKGKQVLSQIYDDINNKEKINFDDVSKQLDRINADTITTFAIFKQAVKNGEKLPIESIEGSMFSKKNAGDFSNEQVNEMSELYDKNYENHKDRELISKVKEYFNTAFIPETNKQKNFFYTFEKDNRIRAFVRFEEKKEDVLYASALNVDEASKNFGLGEAMMDEALGIEARNNILHATCLIDSPSNMRYFEKGFISQNFVDISNTRQFNLIWNEQKNKNILSKQISKEELIKMFTGNPSENIEIRRSKELKDLHLDIPQDKSLTRCFLDKKSNEWFAVYEKVDDDYDLKTSETK